MKVNLPKHRILQAIGKFQYLSAFQLTRLLFSEGSQTYTWENVSALRKAEYVAQLELPSLTKFGRPRAFYCLTSKGYRYLDDPTLPDPPRFRSTNEPYRNALFLKHTESSNDLLILAHNLPRVDTRLTLTRSLTEAQLKKRKLPLRPDGWIELYGTKPAAIAFEMDRATEGKERWKAKIGAYSRYIRDEYRHDFQATSLTIAVVTSSRRRVADLLLWSEEALREVNDLAMAPILYFASFNPVETNPAQVFEWPIWTTIHATQQRLLPDDIFS